MDWLCKRLMQYFIQSAKLEMIFVVRARKKYPIKRLISIDFALKKININILKFSKAK